MSRCATITEETPALIISLKGYNSTSSIRSIEKLIDGRPKWESVAVSPCPGKCFAEESIPASCIPCIKAIPFLATFCLSSPKERFPIIGFFGFVFMSTEGAKLM